MSALPQPSCPTCRAELDLQHDDSFDAWVCPNGDGLAFTLSEAYERLRDDEVHAIWQHARAVDAAPSARGCPMCARTMVAVSCESAMVDVCLVDEVLWFDAGELDHLPPDVPEPSPSAEQRAELAQVTEDFGEALDSGWGSEEAETLTGRLTNRLLRARDGTTTS